MSLAVYRFFFNLIVFNGSATRSDFHVKQKIEKCTAGGIFMYAMYAIPGQTCQIYSQKLTFYPKSFPKKTKKDSRALLAHSRQEIQIKSSPTATTIVVRW